MGLARRRPLVRLGLLGLDLPWNPGGTPGFIAPVHLDQCPLPVGILVLHDTPSSSARTALILRRIVFPTSAAGATGLLPLHELLAEVGPTDPGRFPPEGKSLQQPARSDQRRLRRSTQALAGPILSSRR